MKREIYNRVNDKLEALYESGKLSEDEFDLLTELIEKSEKYKWHDLRKNPDDLPEAETEVDVVCIRGKKHIRTHGFYEDGNVHTEESNWFWEDINIFGAYCEETDDYIIPEGWWEFRHYNPDECFNGVIDDKVIAWRYIENFEVEE